MKKAAQVFCRPMQVLVLLGILMPLGCGYRPPFPPALHTSDHTRYRAALPSDSGGYVVDGDVKITIGGVRLARRGVYLDLIVYSSAGRTDIEMLRRLARELGMLISDHDNPNEFVEMVDGDGGQVGLGPMEYPMGHRFPSPPRYCLDGRAWVQVCMLQTGKQLKPGQYRLRFASGWDARNLAKLARPVDYCWREVDIDWPTSG